MKRHVLFVCLMLSLMSTFLYAIQDSDDDSLYETLTTPLSRQGRARCPLIRNALKNGWVKMRSRGRIAKFMCNKGFELIGNRINTCIQSKWNNPLPICVARGCQKIFTQPPNKVTELFRGSVSEFSCELGYSFEGSFSSYRIYCNGSQWISTKSTGDLLDLNSNQTLPSCKMSARNASLSCDFETSLQDCGWLQDHDDDFDWLRNQFATPSGSVHTGPSFDHTLGPGKAGSYLYVESSSPRKPNDTARIISPVYLPNESNSCFVFYYHMYGKTTGSLKVYIKEESQVFSELHAVWMRWGDAGDEWKRVTVSIQQISQPFQIIIEAVRGSSYVGDTAIDDLALRTKNQCSDSTYVITTKASDQWSIPTPQSQIASQDDLLNTETPLIASEELSTIMVSNSAITAKSNSKISTITTMFVKPVININATSNESTSLSADDSKTLMSRITEDMNKSNAFTLTNIIQEVSTLTTSTSPIAFQTKIALTDPTLKTSNTTLSVTVKDSDFSSQTISPKLVSDVSTIGSRDTRPSLTSIPVSTSKATSVSKSTEPIQTSKQKPLIKVLNSTARDISSNLSVGSGVTSSESKVQRIIESKTTAAIPITTDSTILRSNHSVTQNMNQTIAMRTTTSTTATNIVTTALSNNNDQNYFHNNTKTHISIQTHTLVSTSTLSLSLPINGSLLHKDSTSTTTIAPIIRTTSTMRRRRKSGTKTNLPISSASSNSTNNTSLTIVVVSIILISVIALTLSLYFFRKRKNIVQHKLSEDSEMRYLSMSEVSSI